MNLRNVSVSPQAKVKQVGNTTFEIIMEYNTPINVSVEFQLPCEQDSMVKSIQLHYSEFISTLIQVKIPIIVHDQLTVEIHLLL